VSLFLLLVAGDEAERRLRERLHEERMEEQGGRPVDVADDLVRQTVDPGGPLAAVVGASTPGDCLMCRCGRRARRGDARGRGCASGGRR
jgi:hypothetical protein